MSQGYDISKPKHSEPPFNNESGGFVHSQQTQPGYLDGHYPPYPNDEDEINLRDLWMVLVRRRWVVMLFAFVVIVSVVIGTFLSTPLYRASLTLQIDRETAKVLQFQDVQPLEGFNERDFYQTQYELLKSRTLVRRVIDELNLDRVNAFTDDVSAPSGIGWLKASITGLLTSEEESTRNIQSSEDRWVDAFLSRLNVSPIKNSRLVNLHFDSASPELAARIVNIYARNFISMNLERRFDSASYAKSFLEDRLSDVKARLEDSEKKLINFARENEIINLSNQENINTQKLRTFNNAVAKAEEKRIASESKFQQLLQAKTESISEFLSSSLIQQLKQTRAKHLADYQDKLKIYKPAYPAMLQLKEQIAEIENQIEEEIGNIRDALKTKYLIDLEEEKKLKASLETLKMEVLALQDRSIRYNILKREVDTSRELYEGLLQRMKEVGVAGGVSTNNVFVVDAAEVPRGKYKPKVSLNVVLAVMVGLMGGVFLAFLIDYLDDTIKHPDDLERRLQVSVLGMIPQIQLLEEQSELGLQSHFEPASILAEAYRSARTSLMLSTSEGAPKVLLVTSSAANEGKTTSAINLATVFAQMDKKVLLMDCDLRNPSVHQMLGHPNHLGLSNYLTGDASPVDISSATEIENLFVITAGPVCPNPAELLASDKMKDLLILASEKFDFVIMDGPPVLGLADALVLSHLAKGTALVAEMGGTRQQQLESTVKRLRSANSNIVGGILTKVKFSDGYYGNYYYYQEPNSSYDKLPV